MTRSAGNKPLYRLHNHHGRSARTTSPIAVENAELAAWCASKNFGWDDEALARIDLAVSTRTTIRCACGQTRFPKRLEKSWTRDTGYNAARSSCEASSNMLVRDWAKVAH